MHRLFDGHPECWVTAFELQLGTELQNDSFSDWFSAKYRWPVLPENASSKEPGELFDLILDLELKDLLRDPIGAKHSNYQVGFNMETFRSAFRQIAPNVPDRATLVRAYIRAMFQVWEERQQSGQEKVYLSHCPTFVLDADLFMHEVPELKMIHLVRNPVSGYADFLKRVPEMCPHSYARKWSLTNALGFYYHSKFPERVHLVCLEELLEHPEETMIRLCDFIGIGYTAILKTPTWNGKALGEVMYPFGGIPRVSVAHEKKCATSVSVETKEMLLRESEAVIRLYSILHVRSYLGHV